MNSERRNNQNSANHDSFFRRAKKDIAVGFGVLGVEIVQIAYQKYANSHFTPQTITPQEYFLAYHTGDYLNGYAFAFFPDKVLHALQASGLPISDRTRRGVSSVISLAVLLASEVPPITHVVPHIVSQTFGTPDYGDIPMGLAGIVTYVLANYFIYRNSKNMQPPSPARNYRGFLK